MERRKEIQRAFSLSIEVYPACAKEDSLFFDNIVTKIRDKQVLNVSIYKLSEINILGFNQVEVDIKNFGSEE